MSRNLVHLTASLSSAGFDPGSWRRCSGDAFPVGRRYRAMAQAAERGGLDAVWVGGDPLLPIDGLPLLGSLIAVTERIGLGAVWAVAHAEPFHVARVFATLDHLSSGRTGLVVGLPGEDGAQFGHVPALTRDDALGRAGELIDVARQLWDSWEDEGLLLDVGSGRFADPDHVHPVEHQGRFFTVRGPLNVPRPPQGNPVVVFELPDEGAARALAMREADVLLVSAASKAAAGAVRAAAREGQRVLVNVTPSGTAEELVDRFADWVGSGVCDGFNLVPAVLPDDLDAFVADVVPLGRARGMFREAHDGATLRAHFGLARPRSRFSR